MTNYTGRLSLDLVGANADTASTSGFAPGGTPRIPEGFRPDLGVNPVTATGVFPSSVTGNWNKWIRARLTDELQSRLIKIAGQGRRTNARVLTAESLGEFLDFWNLVRGSAVEPEITAASDGTLCAEWFKSRQQRLDVRFVAGHAVFGLFTRGGILEGSENPANVARSQNASRQTAAMVRLVNKPTFAHKKGLARYVGEEDRLSGNRTALSAFIDPPADKPLDEHLSVNSLEVESLAQIADYYLHALQRGTGDVSVCVSTVQEYADAGKKSEVHLLYDESSETWQFVGDSTKPEAAYKHRPVPTRSDGLKSPSHCGVEFVRVMSDHQRSKFARRLSGRRYHEFKSRSSARKRTRT